MGYEAFLAGTDALFGWMLALPGDLPLVAAAVLTSAMVLAARVFVLDQDLLGRCRNDTTTLKRLIRRAKKEEDSEAIRRFRKTLAEGHLKTLTAELKMMLVILLPTAVFGMWCFERLAECPLKANEPVTIRLHKPLSAAGELAHAVPTTDLEAEAGWIRRFEVEADRQDSSVAEWRLLPLQTGVYVLKLVHRGGTCVREITVGARYPGPSVTQHSDDGTVWSEVRLQPRRLFGIVPGIPIMNCPPWLTGYLVLALVLVFAGKTLLRIK